MNKIKKAYRQNEVEGTPPERITLMLFDGALGFIEAARVACLNGDPAGRGERITRALAIIGELQATLDFEQGGEIAENLMRLYDYITRQLLNASLQADSDLLVHVASVLGEIRDGWAQMIERLAEEKAAGKPVGATVRTFA